MSNYPNLQPGLQNAKDTVVNNASAAYDSLANGPAAEKAKLEGQKTSVEYNNLLSSRKVPDQPAATGQSLTHYHSFFYSLLSWENPRVTTISFASIITFIFFTRYVPILKYLFKGLYVVLGITSAAEVLGKLVMDKGFASHMRPRKYYTIPRENLEAALDDVEQLVNFFIIEFQRIIFAENVFVTIGAFVAAFLGYFLVKFVPKWGLALLGVTLIYTVPLIYINNREAIDSQLSQAGELISQQTQQVRDLAAQHTSRATEIAKSTASDYSAKAQELIGQAKTRAGASDAPNPANMNPAKDEPEREIKKEDLPDVPSTLADKASAATQVASEKASAAAEVASEKTSSSAPQTSSSVPPTPAADDSQATELNAPSVPTTEPSLAAHTAPVLPDTNVHNENSAPENVRTEAPLL